MTEPRLEAKTIHDIKSGFGEVGAGIANRYHEALDEIANTRTVEEMAGFWDRLTPEERSRLLLEHKADRASEVHSKALEDYRSTLEDYRSGLEERSSYLRPRLFGVEDAGTLSRVALASDDELTTLMDRAALADNRQLAKAVFFEATQRGAGDLMARYFDEVDPEARTMYEEWSEIPSAEVLERQGESVETIIPAPELERLTPPARAGV
jgi:hypothetical protein